MSKLRSVSTSFWSDPFIEDLSPSEKLLYLYFITNDKTNMLGIYELSIKKISFETGVPKETVSKALELFESKGKVKYVENYIVLTKFMKHQNFNTNMKKSAIDCHNNLPKSLKINGVNLSLADPIESFETLSNHYGMVRKVEVEIETELEVETESKSDKSEPEVLKVLSPLELKFNEFLKFKKEMKKPVLESSVAELKEKIWKLSGKNENVAIEIIKQSIANGWQGVYELKTTSPAATPQTSSKPRLLTLNDIEPPMK